MTSEGAPLWTLAVNFAFMSLFAVGGANAAVPEMHRLSVVVMGWMTDRQFADMFAMAQLAPGPNVLIVTLIGFHVAGLAGAIAATAGMCGPACIFAFWVARTWDRFKGAKWRTVLQAALVPISLGLVAASAYVVTKSAGQSATAVTIIVVTALVALATRLNPLWIFAVVAAIGVAGLV
jgi:chromate transporter